MTKVKFPVIKYDQVLRQHSKHVDIEPQDMNVWLDVFGVLEIDDEKLDAEYKRQVILGVPLIPVPLTHLFACWCVRYTPTPSGGVMWDDLKDERSRRNVEFTEERMRRSGDNPAKDQEAKQIENDAEEAEKELHQAVKDDEGFSDEHRAWAAAWAAHLVSRSPNVSTWVTAVVGRKGASAVQVEALSRMIHEYVDTDELPELRATP